MVKAHTALDEIDSKGDFQRSAAGFSNKVAPESRFEPEASRYHLYVALGCPWANGCLTALKFKGLEDIISVSVVHPTWRRTRCDDPEDLHTGWHFRAPRDAPVTNELGHGSFECDDACIPDTVNGCKTIRELYERANDQTGKYTTPVLWCKKEGTIVSNESMEILQILDSAFDEWCKHPERKLFNKVEAAAAEELNSYIYPTVNNGVYRCGFARTQEAYVRAHAELFASLDRLEALLAKNGTAFLTGSEFRWIDLRLYMTLVRFDPVYVVYFKTSHKRLADFPHLLRFVRTCYSIQAVKATTNIKHIKMHYFSSHPTLNTYGILPASDGPELVEAEPS
ncbi:unnamed protein product [Prorocentrum cordatum]|uniref:GST C-terminal domain-containing protein n=1 Tax=Prorocentrum cordatum TaxID=2364126 RepID=A0ABN9WZJ2_9DINO|nr:unnamed protein product [Polarella glacialis]